MSLEKTMTLARTVSLETTQSISKAIAHVPVPPLPEWINRFTEQAAGENSITTSAAHCKEFLCR